MEDRQPKKRQAKQQNSADMMPPPPPLPVNPASTGGTSGAAGVPLSLAILGVGVPNPALYRDMAEVNLGVANEGCEATQTTVVNHEHHHEHHHEHDHHEASAAQDGDVQHDQGNDCDHGL